MNELWIVKFVRKDNKPDEEYYYHSLAEAEHHRNLFLNDDSGLYEKIEIIKERFKEVTMELNFVKSGDYYIPDIKLKKPNIRLGKWGRMRKEYLRLAQPIIFSDMVLSETLYEHCSTSRTKRNRCRKHQNRKNTIGNFNRHLPFSLRKCRVPFCSSKG